jgi:hypothetical protein
MMVKGVVEGSALNIIQFYGINMAMTTEVKKYSDKLCEMLLLYDMCWSCHDTVEKKGREEFRS